MWVWNLITGILLLGMGILMFTLRNPPTAVIVALLALAIVNLVRAVENYR